MTRAACVVNSGLGASAVRRLTTNARGMRNRDWLACRTRENVPVERTAKSQLIAVPTFRIRYRPHGEHGRRISDVKTRGCVGVEIGDVNRYTPGLKGFDLLCCVKEVLSGNNMFNIYRVLLLLLHISYTFIGILRLAWADVRTRFSAVVELCGLRKRAVRTEAEHLVQFVNRTGRSQLPNHLVIVLGREVASFRDIARVIGWCATAGIPCVSFYDHDGLLRKSERQAREELAKSKPELVDYINWNSACPVKAVKNGINGVRHKMQVQLLSYLDGKTEVALLAQSLGKGVINGSLKTDEVGPELLENKLALGGLADPDLAVICGNTCSTYGLLPWHIRVTEFLLLESHHNLKITEFVGLLEKYAKCEQRHGK